MEFTKEFVCRLMGINYGQIPEAARMAARMAIADGVGVAIGGANEKPALLALRRIITGGPSSLLGTLRKGHPADAAWFNGIAMHSLDFDDVSHTIMGHPTTVVLPAALAAAEVEKSSGKSLLRAYILGVEAEATLAKLVNPGHYQKGWHATSTLGTVGAAVAAGLVFGLDDESLAHAIGMAVSMAAGMRTNFGAMTKPLHAGNAARNGLTAARLAGDGFTANPAAIESDHGFVALFGDGKPDYVRAMNGLANPFEIVKPGLMLKRYPCCAATAPALDAALFLREENKIDASMVSNVEVLVHDMVPNILVFADPKNPYEARFSMNRLVAFALVKGKVYLEELSDKGMADEKVRELSTRISMKPEKVETHDGGGCNRHNGGDDSPFHAATVKITMNDGKVFEKRFECPKGSAGNPFTLSELNAKFEKLAAPLGESAVARIWEALAMIEDMPNVHELTEALGAGK